jgi:hypothetical protein
MITSIGVDAIYSAFRVELVIGMPAVAEAFTDVRVGPGHSSLGHLVKLGCRLELGCTSAGVLGYTIAGMYIDPGVDPTCPLFVLPASLIRSLAGALVIAESRSNQLSYG